MDYRTRITIDLTRYGQPGTVELGAPTFRRRTELSNEMSRRMGIEQGKSGLKIDSIPSGDLNILQRMAYVRSAPFSPTVEGFLEYTDLMDEQDPGSADALWDAICEAIERIDKGEESPLDSSQGLTTQASV